MKQNLPNFMARAMSLNRCGFKRDAGRKAEPLGASVFNNVKKMMGFHASLNPGCCGSDARPCGRSRV